MTKQLDPTHAVYVGSFDPMTLGHEDIVQRGSKLFSKLTVGIGINPDKTPMFTLEERMALLKETLKDLPNVEVKWFSGLTVDFLCECEAGVMVRGLRTLTDIDSEFTMTLANHQLEPSIETVFLMASEKYTHVSSSLIKQIARMGESENRDQLRKFVPEAIIEPLLQKAGH